MNMQKTMDNIQLDRLAGDITDEQADKAIEKINKDLELMMEAEQAVLNREG